MVLLKSIVSFLDQILENKTIPDSAYNGLQVEASTHVTKIGFAVDAAQEIFRKAKEQRCDLLVVHHGILWGDRIYPIAGLMKERIHFLLGNNLSLYASHLPLDLHPKYGNNIRLVEMLDLKSIRTFGDYKGNDLGFLGEFDKPMPLSDLMEKLNILLGTECQVLPFGKQIVENIAIVSGGGASTLPEAIEKNADVLLVGEFNHVHYHIAKEGKITLLSAGHYATETLGVKALMPLLREQFGVETVFIDVETGL